MRRILAAVLLGCLSLPGTALAQAASGGWDTDTRYYVDEATADAIVEYCLDALRSLRGRSWYRDAPLYTEENGLVAYVYQLTNPSGSIIVSGDRRLAPVLYFSDTLPFYGGETPDNALLDILIMDCNLRLGALASGVAPNAEENVQRWDEMLSHADRVGAVYASFSVLATQVSMTLTVGPILKASTWGPENPYNRDIPPLPGFTIPPKVGCVATALAQIVNKWQQPTFVFFPSGSYYYYESHETGQVVKIGESEANIPRICFDGSDSTSAALSHALGVSVEMHYGYGSSLIGLQGAIRRFEDVWGYSCRYSANGKQRLGGFTPTIRGALWEDMTNGRPAILGFARWDNSKGD